MKRSIKQQFSITFSLIFIAIILFSILTNVLLLDSFFLLAKHKGLESAFDKLNEEAFNNGLESQEFLMTMRNVCESNNISVIVLTNDGINVISYQGNENLLRDRLFEYLNGDNPGEVQIIKQTPQYTIQQMNDPVYNIDYLELGGTLDTGESILLRSSVDGIKNSTRISNIFLVLVAVIGVFAGVITIQIVTGQILKPILKLTDISNRIKNLDFEAKYEGDGKNEIDQLGKNINEMSDRLESTICELKEANIDLKKDIERKEEQERYQREFIANASHELKTPIALIQGYAEGLKEGISEDKESRDFYCDVIVDEAQKMNNLVKSLMSLNELELGQKELSIERFNLSEMIRNQITAMSILASNKEITVEYEPEEIFVFSDEFRVEEVFRNYLSNAVNHAAGDDKKIKIYTLKEEDRVRVEVFNTGERIPEESLSRLWDKFYKVDKARTREYGGSGVGLSIVKATMELLGQEYGCENCEDGVKFYFYLPLE